MTSKAAHSREYDFLAIAEKLEEVAGPFVGGLVCLERRGRPWRIDRLTAVTSTSVTTASGYIYDLATGQPQFETKEFRICPLTRENLNYLIIAEGLRVADKLKPNVLRPAERDELLPAARALISVYQRLRDADQTRLQERS